MLLWKDIANEKIEETLTIDVTNTNVGSTFDGMVPYGFLGL